MYILKSDTERGATQQQRLPVWQASTLIYHPSHKHILMVGGVK